jgi:DNA-binding NarL/FixJ family response regulator
VITVLIADDQPLQRFGFRMLLESQDDMTVLGEAANGSEAIHMTAELNPEVVLMDVRMPGLDGIEATRRAVERHPDLRVIVLTTFDLDESVTAAIGAGASGFLLKGVPPRSLIEAVRTVHRGDSMIDPISTRRLLRATAPLLGDQQPGPGAAAALDELTPRAREVLGLVGEGRSNTEIAADLVVSEATVKTHIGHLLAKTQSRDRVQLVVLAFRAGLVR